MNTVNLEFVKGNGFIAEVIRTKRKKTASVKVQEGKVSLVVPVDLSDESLESLVTSKTRWIKNKLYLHKQHAPVKNKEYVSGECFSYLGKNYRLKVNNGAKSPVKLVNGCLTIAVPMASNSKEVIKNDLVRWYKSHAEVKLREKVKRYANIIGVSPSTVGIQSFKSRWGSCHISGDIKFNWKIVIAPNRIVDYVVVHELCHMRHHDHSPNFWNCV